MLTTTLYYTSLPSTTRLKGEPVPRVTILESKAEQALSVSHTDTHHVWRVFNPDNEALVHIWIEHPSLVTFKLKQEDELNISRQNSHQSIWSSRTFKLFIYATKVFILPIGFTQAFAKERWADTNYFINEDSHLYIYYPTLPVLVRSIQRKRLVVIWGRCSRYWVIFCRMCIICPQVYSMISRWKRHGDHCEGVFSSQACYHFLSFHSVSVPGI